jgi:inorganic pyrophosphatase
MDYSRRFLGKIVQVVVDRPLGSKHPKFGDEYPVNYGFVPETKAPDGEELDAYIIGEDKALKNYSGRCIAIVHRTNDDDDKLIVCKDGKKFSNDEIRKATHFQEQWFDSQIIR